MTTDLELLGDLAFSAEELVNCYAVEHLDSDETKLVRDELNRILAQKLAKAPEVWVRTDCCEKYHPCDFPNANSTHSARLVAIREILSKSDSNGKSKA